MRVLIPVLVILYLMLDIKLGNIMTGHRLQSVVLFLALMNPESCAMLMGRSQSSAER